MVKNSAKIAPTALLTQYKYGEKYCKSGHNSHTCII
jgi:hypothetical protein